jgi:peptide/nickel transport system permease protein
MSAPQHETFLRGKKPRWIRWLGAIMLGLLCLVGLLADLIASDLPLLLRFQQRFYLLPAVTNPPALRQYDNLRLRHEMSAADWALFPLCAYGPYQHPPLLQPPPAPPHADHWLGTDDRGRDLCARVVHGTRTSLSIGVGATVLALVIGLIFGVCGGYYGGLLDGALNRITEIVLSFPTLFLVVALMALTEQSSLIGLVLVLGLTRWTGIARLVRAEVLRLRALDFISGLRVIGASDLRILLVHLLPNAMAPAWVSSVFCMAGAIVFESALTFLGFGAPPPTASWGEILSQANRHPTAWWLMLFPTGLLMGTLLLLNALADRARACLP